MTSLQATGYPDREESGLEKVGAALSRAWKAASSGAIAGAMAGVLTLRPRYVIALAAAGFVIGGGASLYKSINGAPAPR